MTRHLYGRQRASGEIVFGGDRELLGWDALTPAPAGIAVNHAHAAEILPFLRDLPISRTQIPELMNFLKQAQQNFEAQDKASKQ